MAIKWHFIICHQLHLFNLFAIWMLAAAYQTRLQTLPYSLFISKLQQELGPDFILCENLNFNQYVSLFVDQLCVLKTFFGHLDIGSSPLDHPHELHLGDLPQLQLDLGQGEARCIQPLQVLTKPATRSQNSKTFNYGKFGELLWV